MSKGATIALSEIIAKRCGSVDPSKHLDEVFDLYSIPAFDHLEPEVLKGCEIGSAKQIVQPGDVLLSKIVPHIRRAWIVGGNRGRRIIASSEWIVFRSEQSSAKYLRHVLVGDPFHAEFMRTVSGVGGSLLRARPEYVVKIEIPLPPIAQQKRIAAILDQAEELRSLRRQALGALDAIAQSIFLEMFGDPVTNPKGWEVSKLGDISEQVTDGEHQTPKRTLQGIKLLSARNVQDGRIDVKDVDFISLEEYERIKKRCNPVRGDILISCSGTIGRVTMVETDEPFTLVRSVALIKLKNTFVYSKFLECFLRTPALRKKMQQRANASSQANLFQNQIRDLPAFLPPLPLQQEFTRRVEAIEQLKATHRESLAQLDALFASLQHRAFRGELSP